MAMRSTYKNIMVELSTLALVLTSFGIVVYNWDFFRAKFRSQGYAAAEYLHDYKSKKQARTTTEAPSVNAHNSSYETTVSIRAGSHGQFIAQSYINDIPLTLMADTGASIVMLTYEDADRLGLVGNLNFNQVAHTANGKGRFALINIRKMSIGNVELENVRAGVLEKGKLRISLLGMSFIKRLKRFEMRGKELILVQ